jgi:hypothetical protein
MEIALQSVNAEILFVGKICVSDQTSSSYKALQPI